MDRPSQEFQHKLPFKPPILMWLLVGGGFAIDWYWPLEFPFERIISTSVGLLVALAGASLMGWTGRTFRGAGEAFSHAETTRSLLQHGPFGFSRNPVYLAATLMMSGLSLGVNAVWILVVVLVVGVPLLHFLVVLPEETYLEARFGDEWRDYTSRVRRWF